MPTHAIRVIATPRRCAISAAQTGCVATRAVDDATVVNRRLGDPRREVRPEQHPGQRHGRHCARVSARTSARWRNATRTDVNPEPSAVRQNAMASAGAVHAAMSGPEVEMATTATASSAMSVPGGRERVAGRGPALDPQDPTPSRHHPRHPGPEPPSPTRGALQGPSYGSDPQGRSIRVVAPGESANLHGSPTVGPRSGRAPPLTGEARGQWRRSWAGDPALALVRRCPLGPACGSSLSAVTAGSSARVRVAPVRDRRFARYRGR